jgi:hypothetical protein
MYRALLATVQLASKFTCKLFTIRAEAPKLVELSFDEKETPHKSAESLQLKVEHATHSILSFLDVCKQGMQSGCSQGPIISEFDSKLPST